MQAARAQLALLSEGIDLIKLYKALGGGWEVAPDVAAASEPPR
jgi:hypothetical protein